MGMYDQFWGHFEKGAPGLLDLGIGLYGKNAGAKEVNAKVDAAQGPVYQKAMTGAESMLSRSTDPRVQAQQRLNAEMGLLREGDAASEADFMRKLHARGMLDMSTHDTAGQAMNPHVYAYQKALQDRNAKLASESMDKGENAVTANINRANTMQGVANNTQTTGLVAQKARGSNTLRNMEMLKKGTSVLKDSGMLSAGLGWLKNAFGGSSIGTGMDFGVGMGEYDPW